MPATMPASLFSHFGTQLSDPHYGLLDGAPRLIVISADAEGPCERVADLSPSEGTITGRCRLLDRRLRLASTLGHQALRQLGVAHA
jgi:hypothetical protein